MVVLGQTQAADSFSGPDFKSLVRKAEPLPVVESLRAFDVPDGFEMELVAASPDIGQPMNLAFDERGRTFDFLKAEDGQRVRERIAEECPFLAIASTPCTYFTWLSQHLNHWNITAEEARMRRKEAMVLLHFALDLRAAEGGWPAFLA